jgi:hypothetical protein
VQNIPVVGYCPLCKRVHLELVKVKPLSTQKLVSYSITHECGDEIKLRPLPLSEVYNTIIENLNDRDVIQKELQCLIYDLARISTEEELEEYRKKSTSVFKKWIPNSPEKIAAYVAVFFTAFQLATCSNPNEIEYEKFCEEYVQVIEIVATDGTGNMSLKNLTSKCSGRSKLRN